MRWLRKGRPIILLVFASLTFWYIVSPAARKIRVLDQLSNQIENYENGLINLRFQWRGSEPPHPDIAIVAVTEPKLNASDLNREDLADSRPLRAMAEKDFPWRRIVWVDVLDKLFASGARVVAFDIVFASQNEDDPSFKEAIEKYRDRLVLAMTVQDVAQEADGPGVKQLFYPNSFLIDGRPQDLVGCALHHYDMADDQTIRHADHFTSEMRELGEWDESNEIPGLAALAVRKFTGKPVTAGQKQAIRYQGGRQTYPYLPVHELFDPHQFSSPKYRNGDLFRDKIIFIGATYELAHDDKPTPFGVTAGVEIHAQIAADLLTGARLRETTYREAWWVCFAAVFIPALIVFALKSASLQGVGVVGLLVGYVIACHAAFSRFDLLLPMAGPLFGATVTGAFGLMFSFVLEQWEKAHTRKVLNRFVSKRIAAVILKNAEEFEHARKGEKRSVAIFFSDIRGFTTWTEKAQPEHLVEQLNEYFERMVGLIEQSEGNVQKFIGDAILAAWGDTHSNGHAEDVRRVVSTVLKIRPALQELNVGWAKRPDREVLNIGMGVNHGDVIVGEAGAFERREYTVLGDGVNFAARLESATKQFHTDCLVGESAERLTRDYFVYRHVDYLTVKGKTKPVNVYTPICEKGTPAPEWLDDYHQARALFVDRKFTEAAILFQDVKARIGGEDFLCDSYSARCNKFLEDPPADDWDGSYTLTDK